MTKRSLTVCSLFSGIAGIELGLRAAGHRVNLFVERDESALKVLEDHFPDVPRHPDIRTLMRVPEGTDLITAGFPCQDISQAGLVRGLEGKNSGLVQHVFRLAEAGSVEWILLENVAFLLRAKSGVVLDSVLSRIEELGYRWAYRVIDSLAFGVPQRRERVFILACRTDDPRPILLKGDEHPPELSPDNASIGFYWSEGNKGHGWAVEAVPPLKSGSSAGGAIPPAIVLSTNGAVVKPHIRDAERMQGFRADWTQAAKSERDRWRLVGNAVTVPVAEWLGRRLANPPTLKTLDSVALSTGQVWPRAAFNVDGARRGTSLSPFPVFKERQPLIDFLCHTAAPLSERATSGFLSRARASTLNFPSGFLDRVENHLHQMRKGS